MISRILNIINRFSLTDPLIRVNNLFFIPSKKHDEIKLENNFVFRHACMTPLTILSCSLDNLDSNVKLKEKTENLKNARMAIKHLSKLISSVTNSEENDSEFEINKAINEVIYLFKNKYKCEVFYTNFLPKDLKLYGRKLYFQEIIICLLNNAYEAYKNKDVSHISVSIRIIKNQVFIGVVDFAKGMTGMAQKLALLRGISYKENGLGLGLSFVKQVVEEKFSGTFKILSGYGVGTHVQVTIPIPKPCNQNLLQS